MKIPLFQLAALAACVFPVAASAAPSSLVKPGPDGRLTYQAWDKEGDTVLDFSNCGYAGGGVELPLVAVKATLAPDAAGGDDTARIQQAVDALAALPAGPDGFRGALLLKKGTYHVSGAITINQSGIVLRGEGATPEGTVLLATGTSVRPLIQVHGKAGARAVEGTRQAIKEAYVPVGARSFTIADGAKFKVGDTVLVTRHGNAAWIHTIGMDDIAKRASNPGSTHNWQPFDLNFDRVVTAVDGNRITVDAPIACAIDRRWGGGELVKSEDAGRIEHVGIENLRGDSTFDPAVTQTEGKGGETYLADEKHALRLVSFDAVKNAWARNLVAIHFYHGVSDIGERAKWITIQDCATLDPVSVITGGRRYSFSIEGQLNLVQRCYSREGRHAFVFGARVPGPNVFLLCKSERDHATSEPHHRWSCGGLYDCDRAELAFQDRQWMGSGHGWAGANYVAWNTEGSLVCQQPPTAQNFAIGHVGTRSGGAFKRPQGFWESFGQHVEPRSLYLKQLEDRVGTAGVKHIGDTVAANATR